VGNVVCATQSIHERTSKPPRQSRRHPAQHGYVIHARMGGCYKRACGLPDTSHSIQVGLCASLITASGADDVVWSEGPVCLQPIRDAMHATTTHKAKALVFMVTSTSEFGTAEDKRCSVCGTLSKVTGHDVRIYGCVDEGVLQQRVAEGFG
jgi:hypothetical protein